MINQLQNLTVIRFCLMILGFSFLACGKHGEKTVPEVRDISESVYASGVIKAIGQYEVFAPSNGILRKVLVTEGDSINEDQSLFIIDNTISSLSSENARIAMEIQKDRSGPQSVPIQELEGRVQLAEEKYKSDSLLYARQKNLWNQNVGSQVEFEKRELAFKASKTEYENLKLQHMQLKSDLERTYQQALNSYRITEKQQTDFIVKSTITGTVYSILREPGEFVSIQTPVAVIGETNSFEIELQVDEFDIVKVKPGQKILISMDSYRGKTFEAVVKRIEPYMNQRTRTFRVWGDFTETPPLLYPNLSLEANIVVAFKKQALTIPAGYLIENSKVLTAPDETTTVQVGIANLQWVEITDGLSRSTEIYHPAK